MSNTVDGIAKARRGTTDDWANSLMPPEEGAVVYNTETGELKVGDARTLWGDLPVVVTVDPATNALPDAVLTALATSVDTADTVVGTALRTSLADTFVTGTKVGEANGVASLGAGGTIPVEQVGTGDGLAPASIEYLGIRARDRSIASDGTDCTVAFQAAVNEAATAGAKLIMQPGLFTMTDVHIPQYANIEGYSSLPYLSGNYGKVRVQQLANSTTPLWRIGADDAGVSVTLRNLTFLGRSTSAQPLLHQRHGFMCQMSKLFFIGNTGAPALIIDGASNCTYDDVEIQGSGTTSAPAMMFSCGGHAWEQDTDHYSNTNDFNRLTIERSADSALWVGMGAAWQTAYAEFTRFISPHIESPTSSNGGTPNSSPLVRVGNIRALDIVTPMFYGGADGVLSHEQAAYTDATDLSGRSSGDPGGISVLGGTFISRPGGSTRAAYAVRLKTGDGFHLNGTDALGFSAGLLQIDSGYGPQVHAAPRRVQWGMTATDFPDGTTREGQKVIAHDERSTYVPTATVQSPAGTGATCTVTGNRGSGTFTLVTGTGPGAGAMVNIVHPLPFGNAPVAISLTPLNEAAAGANWFVKSTWDTGFQFAFSTTPTASATYKYSYTVTQF